MEVLSNGDLIASAESGDGVDVDGTGVGEAHTRDRVFKVHRK